MLKFQCLNNNVLKIIGCIAMLIDHMGVILFPKVLALRIIGRVAFPIFCYMIAEGCYYTKNKIKHLILMVTVAILMQVGLYVGTSFFGTPDTRISIIGIFAVSVILINIFDLMEKYFKEKDYFFFIVTTILFITMITLLHILTFKGHILYQYCFANYNFTGMIAPVILYIIKKYLPKCWWLSIITLGIMLVIKGFTQPVKVVGSEFNVATLMVLGLIPLLFYNGQKGKLKLKYFFYIFYPVHMIILYLISNFIK